MLFDLLKKVFVYIYWKSVISINIFYKAKFLKTLYFVGVLLIRASQVALVVKNLSANAGDVRDTDSEDPLEEGMATHSSILVWRISWTEEPGGLPSMGSHRVGHD